MLGRCARQTPVPVRDGPARRRSFSSPPALASRRRAGPEVRASRRSRRVRQDSRARELSPSGAARGFAAARARVLPYRRMRGAMPNDPASLGGNRPALVARTDVQDLLLLLHPDLGALRTLPLPLLVVDVPLELFHRDFALSTRHVYTSIAPKSTSPWRGRIAAGLSSPPPTLASRPPTRRMRGAGERRRSAFSLPRAGVPAAEGNGDVEPSRA